ncbi:hypothetical protein Q9Q94_10350 [Uliginosibacterium sp. 31-16]|uniref:hypothetical protein n=1 Tax=Uliginosibacterium sp. 31-16 TaxID=3068315 RepID=UPI00273D05F7|nr:hypothetical protein [Uliginosibacterium sp. 31-16]MDP5239936.1 hypothetical protein [Uliginosibacterium sp. 31-16]
MKTIFYETPGAYVSTVQLIDDFSDEELITKGIVDASWSKLENAEAPDGWPPLTWRVDDGVIVIDFAVAQTLTKARLRKKRTPLLAELDVAFQRALETGANTSTIVAEKQRLRDLPELVDECTTLDQLKALSP